MQFRVRHSLNFGLCVCVCVFLHWAIIMVSGSILKDTILFKPLVLGKIAPTCPLKASLNSLSSISKICMIWFHFSAIFQEILQSKISYLFIWKWEDYMQLQKSCHELWLVAAPFQMARTNVMPRVGGKRGFQLEACSGSTPPLCKEMERIGRGSWGGWRWQEGCQGHHQHEC